MAEISTTEKNKRRAAVATIVAIWTAVAAFALIAFLLNGQPEGSTWAMVFGGAMTATAFAYFAVLGGAQITRPETPISKKLILTVGILVLGAFGLIFLVGVLSVETRQSGAVLPVLIWVTLIGIIVSLLIIGKQRGKK